MEEHTISNLFKTRLIESKIFNEEEVELIGKNMILYERCYLLGLIDRN